jgi:hypothetical protein
MPSLIAWTFPRSAACCKRLKNFPRKTWLRTRNSRRLTQYCPLRAKILQPFRRGDLSPVTEFGRPQDLAQPSKPQRTRHRTPRCFWMLPQPKVRTHADGRAVGLFQCLPIIEPFASTASNAPCERSGSPPAPGATPLLPAPSPLASRRRHTLPG